MPGRHRDTIRSYQADAARAGVVGTMPLGVRPIRVRRIVGSAGKAESLGPDFLPANAGTTAKANYQAIAKKLKDGVYLPPIAVYQLGNRFYVIDGHTRTAAARALNIEFLDADVVEALPRKEGEINLTHYARKEFERYTGLEGIRLTAAWRYHLLHHHIEGYRLYLERSRGREISLPEAARIFYRTQYLPTLLEIRRRKLTSNTGGRTAGDVYTDVLKAWAEEEALAVSLREMLDRYDETAGLSAFNRARRRVTEAVDATLPKAIPPIGLPRARSFADADVQDEMEGLNSTPDEEPGDPNSAIGE